VKGLKYGTVAEGALVDERKLGAPFECGSEEGLRVIEAGRANAADGGRDAERGNKEEMSGVLENGADPVATPHWRWLVR
jgi:hypothetical protein